MNEERNSEMPNELSDDLKLSSPSSPPQSIFSKIKKPLWGSLKLATALIIVFLFMMGILIAYNKYERSKNDDLTKVIHWTNIKIPQLGIKNIALSTKWRSDTLQYKINIDSYSDIIKKAIENRQYLNNPTFIIKIYDKDDFCVKEIQVALVKFTRVIDTASQPTGIMYEGTEPLFSADAYRSAESWNMGWRGFPKDSLEPDLKKPIRPKRRL